MDNLIKRQDVIDIIMGDGLYCDTYDDKVYSAERIKNIPTVVPSEYSDKLWKTAYERGKAEARPRTGKWLMVEDADEDGNARYECSLCHAGETHTPRVKVSYCWNCGARMTEESK